MYKIIVFVLPFLFGITNFHTSTTETFSGCTPPGWIQKTGSAAFSYSMQWESVNTAVGYEVWYTVGQYTSPVETVIGTNQHTFYSLQSGSYTFYVRTLCSHGSSSIVGNNDILEY